MLTKLNTKLFRRLDPKTGVSKPFENVSCQVRIQNFFQRGASNFVTFSNEVFSRRVNVKQFCSVQKKMTLGGSGGHAPPKHF